MRRTQSESSRESNCHLSATSWRYISGLVLVFLGAVSCWAQAAPPSAKVAIDWDKTFLVSRSTPTLQVVVNPMLHRGSSIHDGAFSAVKALGAEDVRYVPWL